MACVPGAFQLSFRSIGARRLSFDTIVPVLVSLLVKEPWCHHSVLPSPFVFPSGRREPRNMDPSSPEAHEVLRYYNVAYDEVDFYQFHHQIGKYASAHGQNPGMSTYRCILLNSIQLLLAGIIVMLWDHVTTL